MKKSITRIFLGLITVVVVLLIIGFVWSLSFKPDYDENRPLTDLQDSVEVFYDQYGVPHILASNETDAYRALGYIQAKDRFFQMDLFRRIGSGTLSELFGKDMLKNDKFLRALQIKNHAQKSINQLNENSPWTKGMKAYVDGVNEYLKENKPIEYYLLGTEPKPFALDDIYYVTGYMSYSFAMAIRTEPTLQFIKTEYGSEYLSDLAIDFDTSATTIPSSPTYKGKDIQAMAISINEQINSLNMPDLIGSNSWIASGTKTKSGYPLFANDPHISFSQPAIWYEAHIITPEFNFYGSHLPGVPFGIIGHTEHHSWGFTMFENDDMDLYLGKSVSDKSYQYRNEEIEYEIINEEFKIKDEEPVNKNYRKTVHGVVINDVVDELRKYEDPVSLWWVYLKFDDQLMEACYKFSHSKSVNEIEDAIKLVHAPGLNVMYADTTGNIAWYAAAKLPDRSKQSNSKFFLDGVTGKDDITEYYPFSVNPKSLNPETGFVYSANNQSESLVDSIKIPGYYLPDDRANRIIEMIEGKDDLDIGYFQKMQLDNYNETSLYFSQWMSEYAIGTLKKGLEDFNGNFNRDSDVSAKIQFGIEKFSEEVFKDELGEELYNTFLQTHLYKRTLEKLVKEKNSVWIDNVSTENKESVEHIMKKVIKAINSNDFSNWASDHILTHEHPVGSQKPLNIIFNVGPFEVGSTNEALNNYLFKYQNRPYKVHAGPSMRKIVDLSDVNSSLNVLPTGQSGVFNSEWYDDQSELYVQGNWRPMLFKKDEIKKNSKSKSEFYPAN
ncbi:penicillin acylase family protein [Mangrovivirga cuniculi]|uniref:Penicillin acylase family protein n=1 Tax=Mangrovivirga cuniculi TaxID=2715131 RepID=A0A4D7JGT9_9BACT|nr:penicillin acylase family protein [Mangrovivirga cuniculi]QCK13917.1 penicillin acylase family protein [Mangrovivirga cuniculi]